MSDLYPAIKALHVVSATVLFGTGLGTAFHMWMAHRSRDLAAIAVVSRQVVQADLWFTTPAVVAQPATGILLIWLGAADPWLPWLVLSYVLYGVAGLCWLPVLWLQVQTRDLATAARSAGTVLPARYVRLMRIWFWLGWPAFLSVLAILWLMTTKPAGLGA